MNLKFNIINIKISLLFLLIFLVSGYKYPESLPVWQDIFSYRLKNLEIGKTTLSQFRRLTNFETFEKVQNVTTVSLEPKAKDTYKAVRVGFRNNRLDWIEFVLNKEMKISDFIDVYGQPRDINTIHSDKLNYYDYGFFSVSVEKTNTYAKHLTIFEISEPKEELVHIIENIPELKYLKSLRLLGLKPGYTLEEEFKEKYPFLTADKIDATGLKSVYVIDKSLGERKKEYKSIEVCFNNGLLNWINITPQNLSLADFIKIFGTNFKYEQLNKENSFYTSKNLVMTLNTKTNKVKTLGIISP